MLGPKAVAAFIWLHFSSLLKSCFLLTAFVLLLFQSSSFAFLKLLLLVEPFVFDVFFFNLYLFYCFFFFLFLVISHCGNYQVIKISSFQSELFVFFFWIFLLVLTTYESCFCFLNGWFLYWVFRLPCNLGGVII